MELIGTGDPGPAPLIYLEIQAETVCFSRHLFSNNEAPEASRKSLETGLRMLQQQEEAISEGRRVVLGSFAKSYQAARRSHAAAASLQW